MQSEHRQGRANADTGVGGCAVDVLDASEYERIALRDLRKCTDCGGIRETARTNIGERPDDGIAAARGVAEACALAEERVGAAHGVLVPCADAEERVGTASGV